MGAFEIMLYAGLRCWATEPADRPTFAEVNDGLQILPAILRNTTSSNAVGGNRRGEAGITGDYAHATTRAENRGAGDDYVEEPGITMLNVTVGDYVDEANAAHGAGVGGKLSGSELDRGGEDYVDEAEASTMLVQRTVTKRGKSEPAQGVPAPITSDQHAVNSDFNNVIDTVQQMCASHERHDRAQTSWADGNVQEADHSLLVVCVQACVLVKSSFCWRTAPLCLCRVVRVPVYCPLCPGFAEADGMFSTRYSTRH